ncbi:MAG: glycosyltransferase family 1 protein [Verrucomicrobiales bacterium]|jgi:glycosyltransferase involved in cell wall biosynthesis|nr:glycosyltransferase family 1 protein [Verrucomicrobiales bacterium]
MRSNDRPAKCAWFTDTIDDLNGVARTVRTMGAAAGKLGHDLTVVTCRPENGEPLPHNRKNFRPVMKFALPKYPSLTVTVPPFLSLYRFLRQGQFGKVIVSTPGPVGLSALVAAKLLGIRSVGIDHTDFPQYIRYLTGSRVFSSLATQMMKLIYGRFDTVFVNSEFYRRRWMEQGFAAEKLHILPRGLDTGLFNYRRREEDFWRKRGANHQVLLYVGRVSKEKELGFLANIYQELKKANAPVDLAIVGEGPYLEEMRALVPTAICTGPMNGDELGAAYASADLFMFPSTTDTFGNVVIEAVSSGLPVFVSDVGGPKELISGSLGKVLPAGNLTEWVNAVQDWLQAPTSRETLTANAEQIQRERNWDNAVEKFWSLTMG